MLELAATTALTTASSAANTALSVLAAVAPPAPVAPGAGGMPVWQAAVLGVVEGVTEYLPVSSTGHLIIAGDLMGTESLPISKSALDGYDVIIQGGAILAVAGLYLPRFVSMLRGLIGRDAAGLRLVVNLVIAFLPAALLGLLVHKAIKTHLFSVGPVAAALIVGGVFMIVIDRWVIVPMRRAQAEGRVADAGTGVESMSPAQALTVGFMQVFSLIPGTSRSMTTIAGGVLAGLRPSAAAEFSFLLGVPTLLAAGALELFKNLRESARAGTPNLFQEIGWAPTIAGMVVAAVSAAIAVRWLVGFLNRHGLSLFGYYRIALGLVLIALVWGGWVTVGPSGAPAPSAPTAAPEAATP